ncbi:hypothetical protein NQ318_021273 [Aromia moschata]|uniref:Uncharacterized protein n=1 Tax=Aromia moschata TaxID=1265417 RepID=A0AAV8ZE94_9CUCU|nr:hypothetical protein NQ318_021273 [Aromia moschata]
MYIRYAYVIICDLYLKQPVGHWLSTDIDIEVDATSFGFYLIAPPPEEEAGNNFECFRFRFFFIVVTRFGKPGIPSKKIFFRETCRFPVKKVKRGHLIIHPETNTSKVYIVGVRHFSDIYAAAYLTAALSPYAVMQEQLNECTLKDIPKDADRRFERLYRFTHDFVKLEVLCLVMLAVAELQHEILNLMGSNIWLFIIHTKETNNIGCAVFNTAYELLEVLGDKPSDIERSAGRFFKQCRKYQDIVQLIARQQVLVYKVVYHKLR